MRRHIENAELTCGSTGETSVSYTTSGVKHPLAQELDSIAKLGQSAMRQGNFSITFPSGHRSTRSIRKGRRT